MPTFTSMAHVDMGKGSFVSVQREVLADCSHVFSVKTAWHDLEREQPDISLRYICQDEANAFRLFSELINCTAVDNVE